MQPTVISGIPPEPGIPIFPLLISLGFWAGCASDINQPEAEGKGAGLDTGLCLACEEHWRMRRAAQGAAETL